MWAFFLFISIQPRTFAALFSHRFVSVTGSRPVAEIPGGRTQLATAEEVVPHSTNIPVVLSSFRSL